MAGEPVTSLAEAQAEAAEAEAAVEARGSPRGLRRLVGRRGRRRLREALEAASEEAAQAGPHVEGPSWQCRSSVILRTIPPLLPRQAAAYEAVASQGMTKARSGCNPPNAYV